jgi:GT2 family glycosyltransferase
MNDPLLTVLIPTYQSPQLLQYCIQSIVLYTEYPYKIVILNNDPESTGLIDDAMATADFDGIEALHMKENGGWMTAINAGMDLVDTPYTCMLNDDVVFVPGQLDFWRKLTSWFDANDKIAEVGPCTNYAMGNQSLFTLRGEPAMYVPWLIGFCAVIKTDVFREVGLLDESLPGGDDLDLGCRLTKAGYNMICDRTAYIHHIGQQTGQKVHAGYWNTEWQSDKTNNALIRKHGVKTWYHLKSGDTNVNPADYEEGLKSETMWRDERLPPEDQKGINLGSGARSYGTWGLDLAKPGDKGSGGRAYQGAINDLTADAMNVPAQDGSLDYVLANHILEHLVDPLAALKEWRRAVKPGGTLLLTAPNHAPDYNTMLIDYTHLHALTPGFTSGMLEISGWKVLEAAEFPLKTFGILAEAS